MLTGAVLLWQGRAEDGPALPPPPEKAASAPMLLQNPPAATEKSKEQKRFDRADRDNDGRITLTELIEPRRKAYAKLDTNGDGKLSFEEWAHTTIDKFEGADKDKSRFLTPAEYATTAPPPPKRKTCSCERTYAARDSSDDE